MEGKGFAYCPCGFTQELETPSPCTQEISATIHKTEKKFFLNVPFVKELIIYLHLQTELRLKSS